MRVQCDVILELFAIMFVRLLLLSICTLAVHAASTGVLEEPKLPIQAASDGAQEPKLPIETASDGDQEPKVPIKHVFRRDYTFDEQLGGWLKFNPMPVVWKDAALRCFYEGAILASPVNGALTKALSTIIAERGSKTTVIFTGISNVNSKSEYQSIKGLPVSSIWLSWLGTPQVSPLEENCVVMNAYGGVSAVRCSDPHPYVCYRQRPLSQPNKCGTVNPDYKLNKQTGKCYRVSSEHRLAWSDAFRSCAIDGGHLAIINSDEEARILWELCRKYSHDQTVLIGVRAWGDLRAWITVQGQSIEEAGYADWRRGEPNNANNNEYCVGLHPGNRDLGVMNDVPCNDRFHYICEIEPKFGVNP